MSTRRSTARLTKDYFARMKAGGMSASEALRGLKREIARNVYRTLTTPGIR